MVAHDGKAAAISRILGNDGHIASNCPRWRILKNPQDYSSGFIVRQNWAGRVTVVHNVNKDNAAQMGPGGTAAHINAMLVRYATTISRLYQLSRNEDILVVEERR